MNATGTSCYLHSVLTKPRVGTKSEPMGGLYSVAFAKTVRSLTVNCRLVDSVECRQFHFLLGLHLKISLDSDGVWRVVSKATRLHDNR